MKKRLFSMFLCLCMMFTSVEIMAPTATAATDLLGKPFGKEITANNPYPGRQKITDTKYPDGSEKWTYPCTLYTWQRVYNDHGISLPDWGDAKDWLSGAKSAGFETGTTSSPNSIVVYSGGTFGHVAYVESVNGNTMAVSEGGRTHNDYQRTGGIALNQTGRATSENSVIWGEYRLKGYIYLPVSVDPPETPKSITGVWTSTGPQWTAEISWDKSEGSTYYNVEYRTPKTNNQWKKDPDYSSGNRYISTGLKDYNSYDYRVQAGNAGGVSDWRYYTLGKPDVVTPPAKPENVSATWTLSGLVPKICPRVSWGSVSGAEHYEVQYKKETASSWSTSVTVKSQTAHTFSELLDINTAYDFRVKAVNAAGSSDWAMCKLPSLINLKETVSPPSTVAAPTGISGKWKSMGSNAAAELTWNAVSNVDYYEVGYKKDGGNWETIPVCILSPNTSHVFDKLDSSSSYSLRVRAAKSNVFSDWVECTLPAKPAEPAKLASPGGVSGSWTSMGPTWQARISWNSVSGATYYEVQYRTPKTGNAWRADPDYSSGASYISTGLLDYDSYDYRVRACNSSGTSAWTTYTLTKPIPAVPAAPTGVSGSWTSMGPTWQARISWNAVSGASYYEVQYRTPKTGNAWRADPDYSSGTSYISTGLKDYNSYDYRVRAVNANGASDWTEYTLYK